MSSTTGAMPTPVLRLAGTTVGQALVSLLVALALVMLVRRASGAFVQPLVGLTLVVVAVALVMAAAAVRAVLRASPNNPFLFAVPGLATAVLLGALTLPGTLAPAIAIAWFILIGAEGLSWLVAFRPELLNRASRRHIVSSRVAIDELATGTETELPPGLVQQLTRVREEGRESIHALLLAEIPAGDRQTVIHVAFCPPFEKKPALSAHALDAADVDVRITQAETFGARIELRLPTVKAERRSALIELLGTATCP